MAQTFAEHLAQVAHSIDIVDNEILARFKRLIARYDRETLNIRHVLLLIQEPADHGSGLTIVALESDTPGRT